MLKFLLHLWRCPLLLIRKLKPSFSHSHHVCHRYGHLADGLLDLILVDRTCQRFGVVHLFLNVLTSGRYHMGMSSVTHAKVCQSNSI